MMTAPRLDDTDRHILDLLQTDSRISQADIARAVGMAPSAIHDRLRKLDEKGLLRGKELRIPPKKLGFHILAFVSVKASGHCLTDASAHDIGSRPEVQEMHLVAGQDCYMLKVRTRNTDDLAEFLRSIGVLPDVAGLTSTICLETLKETTRIPIWNPRIQPASGDLGTPDDLAQAASA